MPPVPFVDAVCSPDPTMCFNSGKADLRWVGTLNAQKVPSVSVTIAHGSAKNSNDSTHLNLIRSKWILQSWTCHRWQTSTSNIRHVNNIGGAFSAFVHFCGDVPDAETDGLHAGLEVRILSG